MSTASGAAMELRSKFEILFVAHLLRMGAGDQQKFVIELLGRQDINAKFEGVPLLLVRPAQL